MAEYDAEQVRDCVAALRRTSESGEYRELVRTDLARVIVQHIDAQAAEIERLEKGYEYWRSKWQEWRDIALEAKADNARLRGLLGQAEGIIECYLMSADERPDENRLRKDAVRWLYGAVDALANAALAGNTTDAATIMKDRYAVTGAELNEARRQLERDDAGEAKP